MTCYCANYYGSINCQNLVRYFGDSCTLCKRSKISPSSSPDSQHGATERWVESARQEKQRRNEENDRKKRLMRMVS